MVLLPRDPMMKLLILQKKWKDKYKMNQIDMYIRTEF